MIELGFGLHNADTWSLHGGVAFILLGVSNEALNNGDDSEWIVHGGITMEF